jgi:hypothetical protein
VKTCYKCKEEKEITEFYKDKTRSDGLGSLCKSCKKQKDLKRKDYFKQWQIRTLSENPEYWKEREKTRSKEVRDMSNRAFRLRKYGLDEEKYQEILASQDFRCAICKRSSNTTEKEFAVDHDHKCCPGKKSCGKCVRGLLCQVCNQALGMFQDSEQVLENAILYLQKQIQPQLILDKML